MSKLKLFVGTLSTILKLSLQLIKEMFRLHTRSFRFVFIFTLTHLPTLETPYLEYLRACHTWAGDDPFNDTFCRIAVAPAYPLAYVVTMLKIVKIIMDVLTSLSHQSFWYTCSGVILYSFRYFYCWYMVQV